MSGGRDSGGAAGLSARRRGWSQVFEELSVRERTSLSGDELDTLADALFWLDEPDASIDVRRDAYRARLRARDAETAALAAWRLFYDHYLVGESAIANGWLERCRRHVASDVDSRAAGWLSVAKADCAMERGDFDQAVTRAQHAHGVGDRSADADLVAMALQAEGRALVGVGEQRRGLAALDEAMVAVINDELAPLYTGWVFCNVISTCFGLADLRRATEWSKAAMRWCASLRDGLMYRGLCRVYSVELACLRGDWSIAERDAHLACQELTTHDRRYAGEAFYLVGEMYRLRGDFEQAEAAYARAHELARLPQPGLALMRAAQDRPGDAVHGLRSALQPGPSAPLQRSQMLTALVEVELELGDVTSADADVAELEAITMESSSPLLEAWARHARGLLVLARDDSHKALVLLRDSWQTFHDAGLAYEAARLRVHVGVAARRAGDEDTARLEFITGLAAFEGLDAGPDAERTRRLLDSETPAPSVGGDDPPMSLTRREIDVLRLVAGGSTNRTIAEILVVSPHTVSRHLSNIFTKIGVTSRSAATAFVYEHGIVRADATDDSR